MSLPTVRIQAVEVHNVPCYGFRLPSEEAWQVLGHIRTALQGRKFPDPVAVRVEAGVAPNSLWVEVGFTTDFQSRLAFNFVHDSWDIPALVQELEERLPGDLGIK